MKKCLEMFAETVQNLRRKFESYVMQRLLANNMWAYAFPATFLDGFVTGKSQQSMHHSGRLLYITIFLLYMALGVCHLRVFRMPFRPTLLHGPSISISIRCASTSISRITSADQLISCISISRASISISCASIYISCASISTSCASISAAVRASPCTLRSLRVQEEAKQHQALRAPCLHHG